MGFLVFTGFERDLVLHLLMYVTGYFWDGLLLHFVASMISGLITTAASMPVDIAKTRYAVSVFVKELIKQQLNC